MGSASHVGKSVTVAAICRCLVRRGITVAPFKSQNMSLNSYVTPDGGEIGMAQAMQAIAARQLPRYGYEPGTSQAKRRLRIAGCAQRASVQGCSDRGVLQRDPALLKKALESYHRLKSTYGEVVIEGAGGAAELNLYDRDIANTLLAKNLRIPIILVADIERGGVFAQIYGTFMLLPEELKPLVKGIIINKFRGDPTIFEPGVKKIEELTGIPVLGVVPYFNLPLPSEDSLSIGDKKTGKNGVQDCRDPAPPYLKFHRF